MVIGLWVEEAPHDPLVLEVGGMVNFTFGPFFWRFFSEFFYEF